MEMVDCRENDLPVNGLCGCTEHWWSLSLSLSLYEKYTCLHIVYISLWHVPLIHVAMKDSMDRRRQTRE